MTRKAIRPTSRLHGDEESQFRVNSKHIGGVNKMVSGDFLPYCHCRKKFAPRPFPFQAYNDLHAHQDQVNWNGEN